jgi:integrase
MMQTVTRRRGRPVGQSDDLTLNEIKSMLALPDRRKLEGMRDYAVLLVFGNTPMRKGEMVSLRIGNMLDEGDTKSITYKGLKKRNKKPYWLKIPIAADVYDALVRYVQMEHRRRNLRHDDPLFMTLGKHGPYKKRPITSDAIDIIVKKYARLAGIQKRVTPHSYRASYVTLRAAGKDPAAFLDLGGWTDIRGVLPYYRRGAEKTKDAAMSVTVR